MRREDGFEGPGFAAALGRVEAALSFVRSLARSQVDGAENVATAYNILRHRGVPVGKRDFVGPVNWL